MTTGASSARPSVSAGPVERVGAKRTLDRLISRAGLGSRATAAAWIRAGRVRVNGRVVRDVEAWVDPARDALEFDGRPLVAAEPLYVALNKPRGYLTSFGDPRERRTVYELLGELPAWVFPVGRLDKDTSGLLLLTNDSDFAELVTNPATGPGKRYRATTRRRIDERALAALAAGPVLADGPTAPSEVVLVGHRGPTSVVELTLHEGRNREVRRMFLAVGAPLKELRRTRIGALELGELASGTWRRLSAAEVRALRHPR